MSFVTPMVRPMVRPMVTAMGKGGQRTPAQIIQSLFAQGQQGFWFPFTDFASLSQDAAGTLPYTAVEQPVGRVLDRSGRGNNASQVTSTARGVVSARVNWLTTSTDFSAPYWIFDEIIAPTLGATIKLTPTVTLAPNHRLRSGAIIVNGPTLLRMECKADGMDWVKVRFASWAANFNLATGAVGAITGAGVSASARILADGFVECALSLPDSPVGLSYAYPMPSDSAGLDSAPFAGDGVAGVLFRNPDRRFASSAALPHQRVTTPTDYDTVGFPKYAKLEVDDYYTCGGGGSTTGFYYSDVIRPMGGAGTRRVIWSDRSGNNGYELAINASDKLEFSAGNGTAITTVASTVSATVAEGKRYEVMDDGTNLSVQIDGSAAVTIARPVVAAGSSTITLYRGASTGYFTGQITEPIYRAGPPPSAHEREVIRTYQMQKAGMA